MGALEGKTALITGAARGQGEAEARLFISEGANVMLSDLLDDRGEAVARELGEHAAYVHLNVTNADEWARAVELTVERFGSLDVLVNNAGIAQGRVTIEKQSIEDYVRLINVNQIGPWLGTKAVTEPMRAAGGGSIINIGSVGGCIGCADQAGYVTTKWAVRGLTKSAALELASDGIRVNVIHPGAIDTDMPRDAGVENVAQVIGPTLPLGRIGYSEDIARMALFLASDQSNYCTGAEFAVDGGTMAGSARLRSG
jgi:3alpha(or 20beta)-hydroxysteroid dehydrogenase